MKTDLSYKFVKPAQLSDQSISDMYEIYQTYYDCVQLELFTADLADKSNVLIIYDGAHMVGFSTLLHYQIDFQSQNLNILFSGDTIMHQAYWGNPILAYAWLRYAGMLKARQPHLPLYWFIIVKGHRTYRYLPVFSQHFYPNCHQATPPFEQALMDKLAIEKFGANYLQSQGIIHYPKSHGQLKKRWASIPEKLLKRPDMAFFQHKNPHYNQGDELVCLCELSLENLKPLSARLFEQGMSQALCMIG